MANVLLIAPLLLLTSATAFADDPPPFKITCKRANDIVEACITKGKATVSIHSPFGVGNAVIERSGEKWPDDMVLRLHLKGLEHFKLTNGKATLEGAVRIQDGKPATRVWKGGKEGESLDAASPTGSAFASAPATAPRRRPSP